MHSSVGLGQASPAPFRVDASSPCLEHSCTANPQSPESSNWMALG